MFGDLGQGLCIFAIGLIVYLIKKIPLAAILSAAGFTSAIFGPTEILIALAQYYGVPADYLLGMTDETKLTRPQKSGEEHGAAQTVPYAFDDILPQFLI